MVCRAQGFQELGPSPYNAIVANRGPCRVPFLWYGPKEPFNPYSKFLEPKKPMQAVMSAALLREAVGKVASLLSIDHCQMSAFSPSNHLSCLGFRV